MTLTDAIKTCFLKYADFSGCASRSEYWWWTLFVFAVTMVLEYTHPILYAVFALGTLVPCFAVAARRLHDTDHSAWWLLLWLVPVAGQIALFIFFILPGKGDSRFVSTRRRHPRLSQNPMRVRPGVALRRTSSSSMWSRPPATA